MLEISKQIMMDMDDRFEFDSACCVDEALKKLSTGQYDAVISDYEMPQKNGVQFLEELRKQNNEIPFILFTGKGREEVVVKALNLGADSYINKNGSPETVNWELVDAINKTVERKKSGELLAKSESKYYALVENSLQGISILLASPLRIVFSNGAFGKILGYSCQELMSLSPEGIMGLVYHEDRAVFFKRMENRLQGEAAESCFEFRAVRKDGSIIWLSSLANRVDYEGQPAVQGMFLDINENKIAIEILRENELKYRELANCLPDIVFETDLNGQLEFANERAAEISGYSTNEIEKGLNILQFLNPEDRERATKSIQRLLSGSSYVPAEYTFVRKDGTTFPVLITATPRICKNKITGLRGIVLNITERKKIEKILSESEEKFRKAFLTSPDAVYMGTLDEGKILEINENFEKVFGYNRQETIGKTSLELGLWTNPSDRKEIVSRLRSVGKVQNLEVFGTRKNGQIFPLQISISVVQANNQQLILGVIRDISSYKKAEEVVKKSEARYRELANFLPEIVFETDLSGKITFFSQRAYEISGFTPEELEKGMNMLTFVVPEDQERAIENIKKALSGEEREGHEYTLYRKNGTTYPAIVKTAPIISENKVTGLRGLVVDITERKKVEEKLQAVSLYSRSLLEASLDPLVTISKEGKITDANKAVEDVTGCPRKELIGSDFSDYFTEPEKARTGYRKVFTDGVVENYPLTIKHKSGLLTDVLYNASIYRNSQGEIQGVFAAARDITERKKNEEALTQERNTLESVTSASGAGLAIISKDYHVLWANDFIKRYKGDTIGKLCYATLNSLDSPCSDCGVAKIYAGKTTLDSHEYCSTTVDGNPYWVEIVATPLVDKNGNITSAVEIAVDITERKKNEEKLRESIYKNKLINEKLLVVGSLTRHDVSNKLMVVKSNLYLLKKQIGDNPKIAKYLEDINLAIIQSDKMFEFSRFYEKIGVEEPSKIDVAQCFNQAVTLLPNLGSIKIVNDCQGLEVMADSLLEQLFYNLLDNSLKHGEKVTQIRLHYTKKGNGMKLFYEDNGAGIHEANKPKLFHEGFSTGKSTGLGLFLIKKMVEVYGWTITEEGKPGKGAKFVITIPTSVFENQHTLENQGAN